MDPYQQDSSSQKVIIIAGVALLFIVILYVVVTQLINMQRREENIAEIEKRLQDAEATDEAEVNKPTAGIASSPESTTEATTEIVPTARDSVIATVGDETIYYADLLAIKQQDKDGKFTPEEESLAIESLILSSMILQKGSEDGFLDLEDTFYNNVNKNTRLRSSKVTDVLDAVESQSTKRDVTVVTLWYENQYYESPIGVEQAKLLAKEIMDDLRSQVVSGALTIEQAGNQIALNEEYDTTFVGGDANALYTISGDRSTISTNSELSNAAFNTDIGSISEVENYETEASGFYFFLQVNQESQQEVGIKDVNSWLEEARRSYEVSIEL